MSIQLYAPDSGVWRALNQTTRLVVLNLLVLATSLPLVTIGASLTAGYSVLLNDADDERLAHRLYMAEFRRLLAQNSVFFVGHTTALVLLGLGVSWLQHTHLQFGVLLILTFTMLLGLVFYPLSAVSAAPVRQRVYASAHLVLRHTMSVILAFSTWLGSLLFPVFMPRLVFGWLFFGIGVPMYLTAGLLRGPLDSLKLAAAPVFGKGNAAKMNR
ncbi:MAG: hypothetical protein ACOYEV_15745 [Candidatus Nanopelagicales bacterium]